MRAFFLFFLNYIKHNLSTSWHMVSREWNSWIGRSMPIRGSCSRRNLLLLWHGLGLSSCSRLTGRNFAPEAVSCMYRGARIRAYHLRFLGWGCEIEIKPPDEHRQYNGSLKHREDVADAFAPAPSEWDIGEVRRVFGGIEPSLPHFRVIAAPVGCFGVLERLQESLGVESVGLFPEELGAVEVVGGDEDVGSSCQLGCLARTALWQLNLFEGPAYKQRRLGVHAQRFGDTHADERHVGNVLVCRGSVADNAVHLRTNFLQNLFVLHQLEQSPRERRGGGLVAGDEHGHQVVSELSRRRRLVSDVDKESQQGRVFHLFVVAVFQSLEVGFLPII
mmetsp:Transcript_21011/g.29411  ORF Transcript_21011/g.29411 Transcript_21011/m.29411 type:complete len:333 (-) Transcript_21011:1487-2485(-)